MEKKIKVAFLSFYNGIYERGVETLVIQLGKRLANKIDLTLYQAGNKADHSIKTKIYKTNWDSFLQEPDNLRKRLLLDKSSLAVMKFTKKILPDLKKERYDLVIPWNNGWETILCKINNVGKILTVGQAGIGWDDKINLWTFPDAFVGFTDYQCQWAKRINPFVKTYKIPNGVDLKIFNKAGKKYKLDLPRPIILSVAALVEMKRHDLTIKAVSKLKNVSLVIVGKGEKESYLREMGETMLPGRFKLLNLPFDRIAEIYRSADLLAFPTSPWESFGLVLLEAMASGLPVVATDDPIRREIIGEAGLFVDPTNTDKYALALKEGLKISKNKSVNPRKQAEKYSWDKIAQKYEELFVELLK